MHRDIKPENIGVTGDEDNPVAQLIDFGFAKHADAKQSRTIVGSFGYLAPEIDHSLKLFGALQQAAEFYDERVDLYSFGVSLFVMSIGAEADIGGVVWSHHQLREMFRDPTHQLWKCGAYQR